MPLLIFSIRDRMAASLSCLFFFMSPSPTYIMYFLFDLTTFGRIPNVSNALAAATASSAVLA
ncbi:hypothetical protein B7L68_06575 [Thermoproteus sp. CP80]|nr:hypothetical protein B7L68_06575 [Thermoproteus sp. CP80]